MKRLCILHFLLLTCTSYANGHDADAGEALYKTKCAVCHGISGGMDTNKRLAPPIAAVRMHSIDAYADEASFVDAVSNWVVKPDESKTRMRGAIRKFKIMPLLGVSKADAEKIATYLYAGDLEKPEGMDKHVEERHGKKPMPENSH